MKHWIGMGPYLCNPTSKEITAEERLDRVCQKVQSCCIDMHPGNHAFLLSLLQCSTHEDALRMMKERKSQGINYPDVGGTFQIMSEYVVENFDECVNHAHATAATTTTATTTTAPTTQSS